METATAIGALIDGVGIGESESSLPSTPISNKTVNQNHRWTYIHYERREVAGETVGEEWSGRGDPPQPPSRSGLMGAERTAPTAAAGL